MKNLLISILALVIIMTYSSCEDEDLVESNKIIGSEGGIITSLDRRVTLHIEPNSLSSEQEISITKIDAELPIDGLIQLIPVYRLEPSGLEFNKPLKVSFDMRETINNQSFDFENLMPLKWDDSGYESYAVQAEGNFIYSFYISDFSFVSIVDIKEFVYQSQRLHNFTWGINEVDYFFEPSSEISKSDIEYAFNLWCTIGTVNFRETLNEADANIIIRDLNSTENVREFANECGVSSLAFSENEYVGYTCPSFDIFSSTGIIELDETNKIEIALASNSLSNNQSATRFVVAHEIGHALGIGHLDQVGDSVSCLSNDPPIMLRCSISIGSTDLSEADIWSYSSKYALKPTACNATLDLSVDQNQLAQDIQIIDQYLSDNQINALNDPSGLRYEILNAGEGKEITSLCDGINVDYNAYLLQDITPLDQSTSVQFDLYNLITGWQIGMPLIKEGGRIMLYIPSVYAYGESGAGSSIPSNSNLIFDISLNEVIRFGGGC